jgi:allantoinase
MTPQYDLVIHGGMIATSHGRYKSDLGIKEGKIITISLDLSSADTAARYDAGGLLLLPGCIDSHMHLWEPGLVAAPDFSAGTLAAIAGGVTTIIDHPLTIPEVTNVEVFQEKIKIGERSSYTDFALHGGVAHDNSADLIKLWEAGCTAFKIFMCESGSKVAGLPSGELLAAFRTIGAFGGRVIIHAEDQSILEYNKIKLDESGRVDPLAFTDWRPEIVEIEAIHRALFLMKGTGVKAVFAHTTVPDGVNLVKAAKADGLDVIVETCPHNLYLTTEHLREKGPWVTYSPPVRKPESVERLWNQLAEGLITTMGSDHGPVDRTLKVSGEHNIWNSQFGIPGTETMVPLMLNAVLEEKISLERMVSILSENPARIYGLYPRKGAIQIGSDADITIVDPARETILEARKMQTSCGWIPYEGWKLKGRVISTIVRGNMVMDRGQILGKPGYGKFLARTNCC